jgi:sugar phosphate permease
VCFIFFALQLDRGNIVQALSDNMLVDLGLNTNQYNYGMTIFCISFLCAELPSQLISKKLGPDNWIPIQMVAWSIVAICQCRITGEYTYYLTRALLGLIEGDFIPDVILYLNYFYTSKELPIRLSFFWGAYIMTSVVSAFLAFGILHHRQTTGWAGWRWLFAIEGRLTAVIGIISWFYLPPSPIQSRSKFRGKDGWFSEREEITMVNRVLCDDPGKVGPSDSKIF